LQSVDQFSEESFGIYERNGAARRSPAETDDYLKRNFPKLIFDGAFFILGLSMVSPEVVLPTCAATLGASNLLIGLIPVIIQGGWFLPPLFMANYVSRYGSKKKLLLGWTIFQRVPWLFLAGLFLVYGKDGRSALLPLFFATIAVVSLVNGATVPIFLDFLARIIPVGRRGYIIAWRRTVGGLFGIIGGLVVRKFLEEFSFPVNYSLIFLGAFLAYGISYSIIWRYNEPSYRGRVNNESFLQYLKKLPLILRTNTNFTHYVVSLAFLIISFMASGFYAVYGLKRFNLPDETVGNYVMTAMVTGLMANFAVGWLGDRFGHKVNLVMAGAFNLLACILALVINAYWLFPAVFVAFSISQSSLVLARFYLVLEFCRQEECPMYIGLSSALIAPFIMSGLVAGRIADTVGYEIVFLLAAGFAAVSLAWSLFLVREPRRHNQG